MSRTLCLDPAMDRCLNSAASSSWLAGDAGAAGRDGARLPWPLSTGGVLADPQGPPPGGRLSPASAGSQGLLRTPGPNPQAQGRKWVRRKESTGLGGQVSRLCLQWPQARLVYVPGLSFFICTMRGQLVGLEKLEAQDRSQNGSTINKLTSKCQLPVSPLMG